MHVDDTPRRQHRLLVGIAEGVEDGSDTKDTLFNRELVGSTRHLTDALARLTEHIGVVILLELGEDSFRDILRHELLPRSVIDDIGKVVNRDLMFLIL